MMIRCFHVAAPLERDSGRLDRRVCNEVSVDKSGEEARPVAYPGSLGVLRVIYNAAMTGIADLVYPCVMALRCSRLCALGHLSE